VIVLFLKCLVMYMFETVMSVRFESLKVLTMKMAVFWACDSMK
jgi:hypothetical protein